MAKYSTGGSSGGDGSACELCGDESGSLTEATVAGATLLVCATCQSHGDEPSSKRSGRSGRGNRGGDHNRKRTAVRNAARAGDVWTGDSTRWEREGGGYDDDPLPYLVSGYGERVTEARQAAGYGLDEVAAALDVPEEQVLAVEQGRATRAGVGGSLVRDLEEHLDVRLVDE